VHYPLLLAFVASWVLVYYCVRNGLETTSKIAVFTVLAPYAILTIFLVRVVNLQGIDVGLRFLLVPNAEKLLDYRVWLAAI
jgi:SNF family Na+-dependent transporter